jgi:4-hydroxy-3-polyprenylbenzoate decarboxylase
LNLAHLRNMAAVTEMGGVIFPPVPAFYSRPTDIEQLVDHTVGRVLDLFGIVQSVSPPWGGLRAARATPPAADPA